MTTLGSVALYAAFALAAYAVGAAVLAGRRRDRRLMQSAANAVLAAFGTVLVAVVALEYALVTHDFSVAVVVDHTTRQLPLFYTMTALWASQPGSLLLWLTVLSGAASLVILQSRRRNRELLPWVTAVLAVVMTAFAGMAAFVSSPFAAAPQGSIPAGLDPSLQNPYMAIHPPTLYLGYVCMAVPYSFAMAALVTGRTDARWLLSVRRWTLVSWAALGTGMLLGAHWAYEEVGWGGYWAWDPVENAALMPWLAATAFLHSVMVQEKKGMLKVWNMVLVSGAFSLSLYGTFLTRSGVVNSVHSFVQSPVGGWLLGLVALAVGFSVAMIVWRLPLLRADHKLESVVSREATFLFNNLLFVALLFAVFWGVLFPILSDAVRGIQASVSTPYYNFFLVIFGLPLLFLTGVGPLIAWRRASPGSLYRTFRWPVASALAASVLLAAIGLGSSTAGLTALTLCVFVTMTIALEFARGASARRALAGGTWPSALVEMVRRNRRRYGGYIVHLAVVVLVIGIVASGSYASVREGHLAVGQSMRLDGYTLTNRGLYITRGPNFSTERVRLAVSHNGQSMGTLAPGLRSFTDTGSQVTSNDVAIRTMYPSLTDLYTILQGVDLNGSGGVDLKVLVNPAIGLVWLAGAIFLLGAVVTVWPDPREAALLARRYAAALAREA